MVCPGLPTHPQTRARVNHNTHTVTWCSGRCVSAAHGYNSLKSLVISQASSLFVWMFLILYIFKNKTKMTASVGHREQIELWLRRNVFLFFFLYISWIFAWSADCKKRRPFCLRQRSVTLFRFGSRSQRDCCYTAFAPILRSRRVTGCFQCQLHRWMSHTYMLEMFEIDNKYTAISFREYRRSLVPGHCLSLRSDETRIYTYKKWCVVC